MAYLRPLLASLSLLALTTQCRTPGSRSAASLKSVDEPAAAPQGGTKPSAPVAIYGYLPETGAKVWVQVENGLIVSVGPERPTLGAKGVYLETSSWIFPGLIDLHGHLSYNVLPLWAKAKGQFINRFEWRKKVPDYKKAVAFNMTPIKGPTECLATRFAELKALTGGVTTMQGLSGAQVACAKDYATRNVEVPGELSDKKAMSINDLVDPGQLAAVYAKAIEPKIVGEHLSAEQGFDAFAESKGLKAWMEQFSTPPSVAKALALALGGAFTDKYEVSTPEVVQVFDQSKKDAAAVTAFMNGVRMHTGGQGTDLDLKTVLADPKFGQKGAAGVTSEIGYLTKWLANVYNPNPPSICVDPADRAGYDAERTAKLASADGVLAFDRTTRGYVDWEFRTRRCALRSLDSQDVLAVITHLGEGQNKDPYNMTEFPHLDQFGLVHPGMVMIHGLGMSPDDMKLAAAQQMTVVWSPFSNLLLYGETLNLDAVRAAKLNMALGADWSPSGSKTLLDEVKIAQRFAAVKRVTLSSQELVAMVTVNPAKALGLAGRLGVIAPNALADIMLVACAKEADGKCLDQPYDRFVAAEQGDVMMTMVRGEPVYGDLALMKQVVAARGDSEDTLDVAQPGADCHFSKAFRVPQNDYDQSSLAKAFPGMRTEKLSVITQQISAAMNAYAEQVKSGAVEGDVADLVQIDGTYACADARYRERFANFVEKEWPANAGLRAGLRSQGGLTDGWSPVQ